MKKILIISGIVLILLLCAAWAYMFINGVPQNVSELFGNFEDVTGTTYTDTGSGAVDVDIDSNTGIPERLRQLTTRPVAGAVFLSRAIRYAERGTGHIYDINLTTGEETRISGTTLQRAYTAVFNPQGDAVALTSIGDDALVTTLGELVQTGEEGSLTLTNLPEGAREAGFSKMGEVLNFFVPDATGGTGYQYSLATRKTTTTFSIPLRDVRIVWGEITYAYTIPSARSIGYVYRVGTSLEYLRSGGKGLQAFPYQGGVIVGETTTEGLVVNDLTTGVVPVLSLFPEKCTTGMASSSVIYCASPIALPEGNEYPDDWYKGVIGFNDTILEIDAPNRALKVISNLEEESGRPIDVSMMGSNEDGTMLYFVNKYDGALWVLDVR